MMTTHKPKKPVFTMHYAKHWRQHAGLTLEEAGARMGRSHATLSRIENRTVATAQPHSGVVVDRPVPACAG
jgi:hypothetical protein